MQHAGIPEHTINVIMALYNNPTFVVRDSSQKSSKQTQTKGLRQGCPLSPYLFGLILTHLFYDVEKSYETLYGEISGVFHVPSPPWDLEYADDTVLLSCSFQQLNRLFHLVQHHGHHRGLLLNEDKCEHVYVCTLTSVCIILPPACDQACDCRFCTGCNHNLVPVPLSDEVKYLGVYLDALSSGRKNLNYRVSQAVTAPKLLCPLLSHSSLPPSWKLTVYCSIVLSILTYAMDSELLSPSQIQKMNSVHFKSLRRIFKVKSSFYHRVLEPTTADCSNEYLAGLAYDVKRVPTPSQLYSQQRLQLLGHLYRHMETLEYQVAFMGSNAYRHVLSPNRPGRPRPHWAESCLTEASRRISFLQSDDPPIRSDMHNEFFTIPTMHQICSAHGSSNLVRTDNTPLHRRVHPYCQHRARWKRLVHKPTAKRHA